MKKTIAFAFVLVCALSLVGCSSNREQLEGSQTNDFEFSFQVIEGAFSRGERVGLSVDLTNETSESYEWEGSQSHFRARVKLICTDGDTEYVISPEPIPDTDDMSKHEVGAGETRSFDFYFTIPIDAVSGEYNLVCNFENSTKTFDKVFTL